jgi:signal peptidase I
MSLKGWRGPLRGFAASLAPSLLLLVYGALVAIGRGPGTEFLILILFYFAMGTVVCGPVFAACHDRLPGPSWVRGAVFGGLWLVAMLVSAPSLGNPLPAADGGRSWAFAVFVSWGAILGGIYGKIVPVGVRRRRAALVIVASFLAILGTMMLFRTFVLQPFNITGAAMLPTLAAGDLALVAKFSYGYSHYSLPFSPPWFSGRVLAKPPVRGDIVIFRLPTDDAEERVGRIMGLPEDRIEFGFMSAVLYINGTAVEREGLANFAYRGKSLNRWRETLPNGVSFDIIFEHALSDPTVYKVPAGHYFILGDYRDNSLDSRDLTRVGYVPFENLIGEIAIVLVRSPES